MIEPLNQVSADKEPYENDALLDEIIENRNKIIEIIEYLKEKENKGHCPTDCKCDLCEAERRIAKLETKQEKPEVLARSAGVFCGRTYSIEEETREGITYITKLRISGEEWVKKGYPPAGPTEQAKGLKALALSDFISMSNSLAQALYDAGYRKSTP